jgi:hypothetical protein
MRSWKLYESDANIIAAMEKIYEKSSKYIKDRNNTALVY